MIVHWYIGFLGDSPERSRQWFDIFTDPEFRHCLVIGYDPAAEVWVYYDTSLAGSEIIIYRRDDPMVSSIISYISNRGRWLKYKKPKKSEQTHQFVTGCWRLYCVPAVKFLLSIKSSALRPRALYSDLVRAGAQPVFNNHDSNHDSKDDKNGKPL